MEASTLKDIVDVLLETMITTNQITVDHRDPIKQLLLQKHRHQFEGLRKTKSEAAFSQGLSSTHRTSSAFILNAVKSFADMRNMSMSSFGDMRRNLSKDSIDGAVPLAAGGDEAGLVRQNEAFLKKIPREAEAANILVGEVGFLNTPVAAFIRSPLKKKVVID